MKVAGLCDHDTAVGLQLAGVSELFVPDGNERQLWNEIAERDDIGIVFVTEHIAETLDRELKEYRLRYHLPIVVEIPDKSGRKKDHVDYVSYLIKKAVGIEVNKER